MFGGEALPFTRHSDVLNATPTDADSLVRLVDELKRRGNAAFQKKSYEEAEVLYSKAIEVNTSNMQLNQHIFHANRSASRCAMGKAELALEDANACLALDQTYVKGFFRKAQALKALKRFEEALAIVEYAQGMEPSNKTFAALVTELKDLAQKQAEAAKQAPAQPKEAPKVTRIEVVDSDSASSASTQANGGEKVVIDDEEIVGHVRGYKKLADGRVTTFFNNELTDEAKRLIGDIAPKKVEDPNVVQIKNVEGGSAWNVGNTFEEKDMTAWAKTTLEGLLSGVSAPLGAVAGTIKVTGVSELKGDASIAVVRGKKRYIFDFTFALSCTATLADGSSVDGELRFLDASSDADGDYDVEVVVPSRYESEAGRAVHAAMSAPSSPFRTHVAQQLSSFVTQFHGF
ncbi:hypothetical protein P43SY_007192 [Pythium insidiosum]|uniref:Activator of Hsp90 ATPase AHSA1-like N-terminal domain-containing protein n=1 Tax=Pythium insidiosum TaxID=114742 RepID=A0AAD5Q4V6_PYTIN|nr:hypothetical protein P43SY_007192 [Pythium insidiosum]